MSERMDRDELIKKMRGRVEQCRRLARYTTDERTAQILNQMADEGETDIKRLLAEEA
jgi:Zn-finger protein